MEINHEVGGFLEVDFPAINSLHKDSQFLNSGRNCFYSILSRRTVAHVYLPAYICNSVIEPLDRLSISYSFYDVSEDLTCESFSGQLGENEFLYVVNYYGLNNESINRLSIKYGSNLIVDNTQALYSEPITGVPTYYSPRKFVGLPDGGLLYDDISDDNIDSGCSFLRIGHLFKRVDLSANDAYMDYQDNESTLVGELITGMSNSTKMLYRAYDLEKFKDVRISNFNYLDEKLGKQNLLFVKLSDGSVPMIYPFQTKNDNLRKHLIKNRIYVAQYWPEVLSRNTRFSNSKVLTTEIIPLPIDQRYGVLEMKKIVAIIKEFLHD